MKPGPRPDKKFLEALASYRPEDARDADVLRRVREFAAGPDAFLRANPAGHFTASAIVVRSELTAMLLVRHAKLGGWLQPGGHVESGDQSVFAAAVREASEETGLPRFRTPIGEAILDLDVHAIPALGDEAPHLHFDVRHLLVAEPGAQPVPGAIWFSYREIPSLDRDGSLTRAARKAQDRLAASPERTAWT
jgi:8-oxo-dGTP pyrophosphatase MutT (NUDIX family)